MMPRRFRKLAFAALVSTAIGVQAASEPYLYGPIRPGEQLARIAYDLRPDKTRVGTWQMMAALYRANPRAFVSGDIQRLRPGAMLVVPVDSEVRALDPELAHRVAREPQLAAQLLRRGYGPPAGDGARVEITEAPLPAVPGAVPPTAPASVPVSPELATAPRPAPATTTVASGPVAEEPGGRRRPDRRPLRLKLDEQPLPDPNRLTRLAPVALVEDPWQETQKAPIPDRWRLLNSLGVVQQRWYDPYNQNVFKGDQPVRKGEEFFTVSLISDTVFEPRRLPTPVGPQSTSDAGAVGIFGEGEQRVFNQNLILALVYLKGDTTFRPPDYELHLTPVFNYNRVFSEERRALKIDPGEGAERTDSFIGMQELFVDYHLRNVSERYDFDSVRFGIQPFSSDFRGFLFQDNQLMARLFGNRDNNLWQYNLAWIRRLEKDTNSGLNAINRRLREDDIVLANLYRQDFPVLGFTSQGLVAHNRNREGGDRFFNRNGFLERPASIGLQRGRDYEVTYLGVNGDGHFGRVNLTVSGYVAVGEEERGVFVERSRDILAGFAAAEASFDQDWIRWRASGLWASGDDDPFDGSANGFDAIFENPVFAGADTSFWIRQPVPLIGGGGVALSARNGVLNSLRSSKEHGQSNFDNPGTVLLGVGNDLDLTPTIRLSFNFNHLWFEDTATLEVARNQGSIDRAIGWDLSTAAIWRPFMQQNIVLRLSGALLLPGAGFEALFPDDETPYSVLGNFIFTY